MKMAVFWDVARCSLLKSDRRFGCAYSDMPKDRAIFLTDRSSRSSFIPHMQTIHSQAVTVQDGPLVSLFGVSCSHTYRHTVGLLWMSDQPVAETSTCTGQLTNSVAQEPEGSSPHSPQPATSPCPEPVESKPPPPPSQSP
jgi:hypothetical protein